MRPESDLMTIDDFAASYRIDSSLVRAWIKQGIVTAEVIGNRRFIRRSSILKPIVKMSPEAEEATRLLIAQGMSNTDAGAVIRDMHIDDLKQLISTIQGTTTATPEEGSNEREGTAEKVLGRGEEEGAGTDPIGAGRPAKVKKVKGRGRGATPSTR